jgi:hypothetical protein
VSGWTAAAQAITLTVDGQTDNTFSYTIPPRSSRRLRTSGSATAIQAGSVRVSPASSNKMPSGLVIFSFRAGAFTVTEAGVLAVFPSTAFRLYAEASGTFGQVGSIQTGIAMTNSSPSAGTLNFELTRLDGTSAGLTGTATVAGNGQLALFLNQIQGFSALPVPFQGVLRISSAASGISVMGLRGRYNERSDFLITTTPAASESSPTTTTEMLFPHIVDAGGYTTLFVLFSPSGQSSSGTLRFFSQTGQGLNLSLR